MLRRRGILIGVTSSVPKLPPSVPKLPSKLPVPKLPSVLLRNSLLCFLNVEEIVLPLMAAVVVHAKEPSMHSSSDQLAILQDGFPVLESLTSRPGRLAVLGVALQRT